MTSADAVRGCVDQGGHFPKVLACFHLGKNFPDMAGRFFDADPAGKDIIHIVIVITVPEDKGAFRVEPTEFAQ